MKTKKSTGKPKKAVKESAINNSGIRKTKKVKNVKKVKNNEAVLETLKKDLHDQNVAKKPIVNRQLVWNAFLKTFTEVEKLSKKQRQIMEFCTNKSRTPPKRKRRFLNFIRHCFPNQADVTDDVVNELFDSLLAKYDSFKSGAYSAATKAGTNGDGETKPKLGANKKKKLKRAAAKALLQNSSVKDVDGDQAIEKVKLKKKKKKRAKTTDMEVDEAADD